MGEHLQQIDSSLADTGCIPHIHPAMCGLHPMRQWLPEETSQTLRESWWRLRRKSATYRPGPPRTLSSLIVEPVVWDLSMLTSMLTFKLSQTVCMLSLPDDTTRNHHKCPAVLHRPPDYPSPTDGEGHWFVPVWLHGWGPWKLQQQRADIYSLVQGPRRCKSDKDLHHRQCLQFQWPQSWPRDCCQSHHNHLASCITRAVHHQTAHPPRQGECRPLSPSGCIHQRVVMDTVRRLHPLLWLEVYPLRPFELPTNQCNGKIPRPTQCVAIASRGDTSTHLEQLPDKHGPRPAAA